MLDEYINEREFYIDDRQGGIIIYSNGEKEERIFFSVNGYYSRWEWVNKLNCYKSNKIYKR